MACVRDVWFLQQLRLASHLAVRKQTYREKIYTSNQDKITIGALAHYGQGAASDPLLDASKVEFDCVYEKPLIRLPTETI